MSKHIHPSQKIHKRLPGRHVMSVQCRPLVAELVLTVSCAHSTSLTHYYCFPFLTSMEGDGDDE